MFVRSLAGVASGTLTPTITRDAASRPEVETPALPEPLLASRPFSALRAASPEQILDRLRSSGVPSQISQCGNAITVTIEDGLHQSAEEVD